MSQPDQNSRTLTMVKDAIRNPDNEGHFMRLKPVPGRVRVWHGERLLADCAGGAVRLLEVGRDLYDPVVYFPRSDVIDGLVAVDGKVTHCPLKGDASYFALDEVAAQAQDVVAWSYESPLDFARDINGLIAFYANKVRIEETGPDADV